MFKALAIFEDVNVQETLLTNKLTGNSKLQAVVQYLLGVTTINIHFPDVVKSSEHTGKPKLLILPDIFAYNLSENKTLLNSLYSYLDIALHETTHVLTGCIPDFVHLFRLQRYVCKFDFMGDNLEMKTKIYEEQTNGNFDSIIWVHKTANLRKNQATINAHLKQYYEKIIA